MKIISSELYKLFSDKGLLIAAVALLLINSFYMAFSGGNNPVPDSAYRLFQADLSEIAPENRVEYIDELLYEQEVYSALYAAEKLPDSIDITEQFPILSEERAEKYLQSYNSESYRYTGERTLEMYFLGQQADMAEEAANYSAFLDEIQTKSQQLCLSPFADSFTKKSAEKTAAAYITLPKTELNYSVTESISRTANNRLMDVCSLLLCCFCAMLLICRERETGMLSLLRSTVNGRMVLVLGKISAVLIVCIITSAVFTVAGVIISGLRFGFPDFTAPIQAVSGFISCPLNVNIFGYLLLFCIVKGIAYFAAALLVFAAGILFKSNVAVYAVSGIIIATQTALSLLIDKFSALSLLRHFNIISLSDTREILAGYNIVSLFGKPVSALEAAVFFSVFLIAALVLTAVLLFDKMNPTGYRSIKLSQALPKLSRKKRVSVSLISHELYKLMITRGSAALLVLMLICSFMLYKNYRIFPDESDSYFRSYAQEYGGKITAETDNMIIAETERFELLSEDTGLAAELKLKAQGGFETFAERYNYASENDAEIVYDSGWNTLFGSRTVILQLAFLLAFLSVIVAPVYSADSRIMPLISSTRNGRGRDFASRLAAVSAAAVAAFSLAHIPVYLKITEFYGTDGLSAPCQSVMSLRGVPFDISLLQYIVLHYAAMLILSLIAALLMLLLSRKIKSALIAVLLSEVILVLPLMVLYLI